MWSRNASARSSSGLVGFLLFLFLCGAEKRHGHKLLTCSEGGDLYTSPVLHFPDLFILRSPSTLPEMEIHWPISFIVLTGVVLSRFGLAH